MLINQPELSNKFQIPRKYVAVLCLIVSAQIFCSIFYIYSKNLVPLRRIKIRSTPKKVEIKTRSNPTKEDWIGYAYIISTKLHIPDDVVSAAKACGFLPQKLPPKLPFGEHYAYQKKIMYESCFRVPGRDLLPYESSLNARYTSLAEISLVYSHRYALDLIAQDDSMQDSDWALIMEDDAVLNPQVGCDKAHLYSLEAIKAARAQNLVEGFIYYGLCGGFCHQTQTVSVVVNDSFRIGKLCYGYCTHAYAVTKYTAKTLFSDMYTNALLTSNMLQIDQGYRNIFGINVQNSSLLNAMVVGENFPSPDISTHVGLMYQCNRTDKNRGTALVSDEFRSQTCFILRSDGATVLQLLQHFAMLVSICLLKKTDPHQCASFAPSSNKARRNIFEQFVTQFRIRDVQCTHNNVTVRFSPAAHKGKGHAHAGRLLDRTRNMIANISYGSVITPGSVEKMPLVPETAVFVKELLYVSSPYIRTVHSYRSDDGSSLLLSELDKLSLCKSSAVYKSQAVGVCVHVSADNNNNDSNSSSVEALQRYFSNVLRNLSESFPGGIAMTFILDKAVQDPLLKSLLLCSQSQFNSSACVRGLVRYGNKDRGVDHDLWTIRQLHDCKIIVLTGGFAGWWGAYLSNAEVIVSSLVKNALPSWKVF